MLLLTCDADRPQGPTPRCDGVPSVPPRVRAGWPGRARQGGAARDPAGAPLPGWAAHPLAASPVRASPAVPGAPAVPGPPAVPGHLAERGTPPPGARSRHPATDPALRGPAAPGPPAAPGQMSPPIDPIRAPGAVPCQWSTHSDLIRPNHPLPRRLSNWFDSSRKAPGYGPTSATRDQEGGPPAPASRSADGRIHEGRDGGRCKVGMLDFCSGAGSRRGSRVAARKPGHGPGVGSPPGVGRGPPAALRRPAVLAPPHGGGRSPTSMRATSRSPAAAPR